jgi:hypothetical protein
MLYTVEATITCTYEVAASSAQEAACIVEMVTEVKGGKSLTTGRFASVENQDIEIDDVQNDEGNSCDWE